MKITEHKIVEDQVVLNGASLSIEEVMRVAAHHAVVRLDEKAVDRVKWEREMLEKIARQDVPIYGVTTGVGANRDVRIAPEDIANFQNRILISHCIGVGPYHPEVVVRAIMVTRANALARGGSGVQPEILLRHVEFLNKGIHPLTPSRGTVGAADLGPMAEMGLAFIGLGEVMVKGERMSTAKALDEAGLAPIVLGPKDGLILCSHNGLAIGHGSLLLHRIGTLLDQADLSAALSLEAFRGNVSPLNEKANNYRSHPGQRECTQKLNEYLQGSYLYIPGTQRIVQDPISYRCMVQVHGACRDVYRFAREAMEVELNSMGDNPLLLAEEERLISHGNFHIQTLSMRFDFLGIQLASLAAMIQNRIQRLMTPEFSGLSKFLAQKEGITNGFSTMQKTYTSMAAEIRHLANPGSLDALPVANGVEDHATMAPFVIQKTERILDNLEYMIGMEFMVAAQAIDLLGHPSLGKGTGAAYRSLRESISMLAGDRMLHGDIELARRLVTSDVLLDAARKSIAG